MFVEICSIHTSIVYQFRYLICLLVIKHVVLFKFPLCVNFLICVFLSTSEQSIEQFTMAKFTTLFDALLGFLVLLVILLLTFSPSGMRLVKNRSDAEGVAM